MRGLAVHFSSRLVGAAHAGRGVQCCVVLIQFRELLILKLKNAKFREISLEIS